MSEQESKENVIDGKNKEIVKCKYCGSKILEKNAATFVVAKFDLPLMKQTTGAEDIETESLEEFWKVPDMFTFENIGFTNQVAHYKYLSCADCEAGPVGYHDLSTKQSYVALARVA